LKGGRWAGTKAPLQNLALKGKLAAEEKKKKKNCKKWYKKKGKYVFQKNGQGRMEGKGDQALGKKRRGHNNPEAESPAKKRSFQQGSEGREKKRPTEGTRQNLRLQGKKNLAARRNEKTPIFGKKRKGILSLLKSLGRQRKPENEMGCLVP